MIKCLIVDDEAPARELIGLHLSGLNEFEVVASLSNGLDAFTFLQKNPVDLVFLDVNMPKMSGLDLIHSLKDGPRIILTTAYREFAVQAYDLDVLDYLVKPVTGDRFLRSIAKYLQQAEPAGDEAFHFFKVGRTQVKIFLKDIIFIEGLSDYVKVHTADHAYVVSEKLSYLEVHLPEAQFTRIHKSFIVALDKLTSYDAAQVYLGERVLPLGRLFKGSFLKKFQKG